MFELRCSSGHLEGKTFALQPAQINVIGRQEGSGILLDSPRVSRKHAELFFQGERLYLRDLNSQNGTYLNGRRIENHDLDLAVEIQAGDEISLGDYIFEVRASGQRQPAATGGAAGNDSATLALGLFRTLAASRTREEFAAGVGRLAFEHLHVERFGLMDVDPAGKTLRPLYFANSGAGAASSADSEVTNVTFEPSMMVLHHVLNQKETIFTVDAGSDARFRDGRSIVDPGVRSIICAPLKRGGEVIGAIYVDTLQKGSSLAPEDKSRVEMLADLVATGYQRFR